MAGTINVITVEGETTGTTVKSVLGLKSKTAGAPVKILSWGIFFNGVTATDPAINVVLQRLSATPTMSTLAAGVNNCKLNPDNNRTLDTVCYYGGTGGETGTVTGVLDMVDIHPQSGYEKVYSFGQEPLIAPGTWCTIRVTATTTAVLCNAKIVFEE